MLDAPGYFVVFKHWDLEIARGYAPSLKLVPFIMQNLMDEAGFLEEGDSLTIVRADHEIET